MGESNFIYQIKQLKQIKPDVKWVNLTYQRILKEREEKASEAKIEQKLNLNLQPVLTFLIILILLTGFSLVAIAGSKRSINGDRLYIVKKAVEKIQYSLVPATKKPELRLEFANRRLEELVVIALQSSESLETKKNKVEATVKAMKDDLLAAQKQLENIKGKENPHQVAQVAKSLTKQTKELEKILEKTKAQVPEDISSTLEEAKKVVQNVKLVVLGTLVEVEKQEQGAKLDDDKNKKDKDQKKEQENFNENNASETQSKFKDSSVLILPDSSEGVKSEKSLDFQEKLK